MLVKRSPREMPFEPRQKVAQFLPNGIYDFQHDRNEQRTSVWEGGEVYKIGLLATAHLREQTRRVEKIRLRTQRKG
jgi:hypothetical protein